MFRIIIGNQFIMKKNKQFRMRIRCGNAFRANLSKTGDDRGLAHIERDALPGVVEAYFLDVMDFAVVLMIGYKVYKA
jgi:hypothetical protein